MFIQYDSTNFEDIIFMLTQIELPYETDKGNIRPIINIANKRCIIEVNNKDTLCLARSIAICLSKLPNKLTEIFQNNLTQDDINLIN